MSGPSRTRRLLQVMPFLGPIVEVGMPIEESIERTRKEAHPEWPAAGRNAWINDRLAISCNPDFKATLKMPDDRLVAMNQRRTSDGDLVVTCSDVTSDTRAVRQLAASPAGAQRLALAATNIQSGDVIHDSRRHVIWMSPAMAELIGRPLEAVPASLTSRADARLFEPGFTNPPSNAACEPPRIFTRFFRAAPATGIQGVGIGLHFSRELIQLHDGSIDVSWEIGRGTTFLARLPVAQLRAGDASSVAA